MHIEELSHRTGVGIAMLRAYERYGLLRPSPDSPPESPAFGDEHVQSVLTIQWLQQLGFTPAEGHRLWRSCRRHPADTATVNRELLRKYLQTQHELRDLRQRLSALTAALEGWPALRRPFPELSRREDGSIAARYDS